MDEWAALSARLVHRRRNVHESVGLFTKRDLHRGPRGRTASKCQTAVARLDNVARMARKAGAVRAGEREAMFTPLELSMLETAIVAWLDQLEKRESTKPLDGRKARVQRFHKLLHKVRDAQPEGSHVR